MTIYFTSSKLFFSFVTMLYGTTFICILYTNIKWPLKCILGLIVVTNYILKIFSKKLIRLSASEISEWQLLYDNDQRVNATLAKNAISTEFFIILNFKKIKEKALFPPLNQKSNLIGYFFKNFFREKKFSTIIFIDSLHLNQFKSLRAYLRQKNID